MSINNVRPVGDDQDWKYQAEIQIAYLTNQVTFLLKQLDNINKRLNK